MNDSAFKQFRRTQIAEMRPYTEGEDLSDRVSISAPDKEAGSPKPGDMIARNPANHDDQWLVSADYFAANFEPLTAQAQGDFHSRLKDERAELDRRLNALNSYLTHNPGHPSPRHAAMLKEQARLMSELLCVLDERLCDIEISRRSESPPLAEQQEITHAE